jgi:hypothetical protein
MTVTTVNLDLSDFSKRTILTGVGWTRNWGAGSRLNSGKI